MIARFAASLTIALTLLAIPGVGHTQSDPERAVELAAEADAAFEAGDFATAAERYGEAHEHYPDDRLALNEMVSWYQAKECVRALGVAASIKRSGATLAEVDRADLEKVNLDCGYRAAEDLFEAGDVEEALTRLNLVETTDVDLAQRIGVLRGKIEERQRQLAVERERAAAAERDSEPRDTATVAPPPEPPKRGFTSPAAFALGSAGIVIGGVTLGKYLFYDRPKVSEFNQAFERGIYECTLLPRRADREGLPLCGDVPRARESEPFQDYDLFRRRANVAHVVGAATAGALLVTATILHVVRPSSTTERAATLAPTIGADFAGITILGTLP